MLLLKPTACIHSGLTLLEEHGQHALNEGVQWQPGPMPFNAPLPHTEALLLNLDLELSIAEGSSLLFQLALAHLKETHLHQQSQRDYPEDFWYGSSYTDQLQNGFAEIHSKS